MSPLINIYVTFGIIPSYCSNMHRYKSGHLSFQNMEVSYSIFFGRLRL